MRSLELFYEIKWLASPGTKLIFLEQKKFYFAWEEEKEERERAEVLSSISESVKGTDIWEISSLKESWYQLYLRNCNLLPPFLVIDGKSQNT